MRQAIRIVVLVAVIVCYGAGAALAHGETVKTEPKKDASLAASPSVVSVDLTEPPTEEAQFAVTDGCGRNVAGHVTIEGKKLIAHLEKGQPGRWKASYRIVSAVDGHPSDSSWRFSVDGDADCDNGGDEATEGPPEGDAYGEDDEQATEEDTRTVAQTPTSGADDGGPPVTPLALGAILVIAAAVVVRLKTS